MSAQRRPTPDRAVAERLTQLTRSTSRPTPPLPPLAPSRSTARVAELHDAHGAPIATLACDEEIGAVVLGRGRTARVRIADERVSRAHASLTWEPTLGAHVLRDLQSANGTVLDGRRVEWAVTLYDGAQLTLGNTELRYRLAGAPGPDAETSVGQRLRAARTDRALTIAELARRTGISVSAIERAERDTLPALKEEQVVMLARALGVGAANLLPPTSARRQTA
jgi:hypothetical protein